ncbi:ABC transporter substrate-binding protein [Rhizobium sp. PAMB 3182]
MIRFVPLLKGILLAAVLVAAALPARAEVALTDLKGRHVVLQKPAARLAVDDGRTIIALSFLSDEPVALLAAWPHDVKRLGVEQHGALAARFPALDTLPTIASNAGDLSVEQVIAAAPDLLVLSVFSKVSDQQLLQLDAVGIPVIYVDFLLDPLANTDRSLTLLGKAIGRIQAAATVVDVRRRHRDAIEQRLAGRDPGRKRPSVFLETHASTAEACCNSPGTGNLGLYIDLVGGHNIGDILSGRPFGQISIEHVVASAPDVYIASGGAYMQQRGGLLVGPGYDEATTRASLDRLLARPGMSGLPAVRSGNVHGLAKALFNPVWDILSLELLAKWVNPDLFADLDVDRTREELNTLSSVDLAKGYWFN